jgi:hypothetical protein
MVMYGLKWSQTKLVKVLNSLMQIKGGTVPREFIPAVEKGLEKQFLAGIVGWLSLWLT